MASSSSSASKSKKRKCIESKIAILDQLKAGVTQAKLADDYGVGSSTVGEERRQNKIVRVNDG